MNDGLSRLKFNKISLPIQRISYLWSFCFYGWLHLNKEIFLLIKFLINIKLSVAAIFLKCTEFLKQWTRSDQTSVT